MVRYILTAHTTHEDIFAVSWFMNKVTIESNFLLW